MRNFILFLFCCFQFAQTEAAVPFYLARVKRKSFVENEVLVKFKSGTSLKQKQNSMGKLNALKIKDLNQQGLARMQISPGDTVETAAAKFKNDANVEYAQPNYIYHINSLPDDASFSQMWALRNTGQTIVAAGPYSPDSTNNPGTVGKDMGITDAWDHITDCSSATVAVIDTGVNYLHSDLSTNMWNGGPSYPKHGYNFYNNNNDPMDLNGHGTHVAGTIGAIGNNTSGTVGVCWKASIMALRVADPSGSMTTANVVLAVDFAVAHGAKVINMSLGGPDYDTAFNDSVQAASDAGVVVVVAAGNDGTNNDNTAHSYPCDFTAANLVCVAALDQSFDLAGFSNYGSTSVDVGAPGVNILSEWPGVQTSYYDTLTAGWTMATTTSGGWGYATATIGGANRNLLVNPPNYDGTTNKYMSNTSDTVWKAINFDATSATTLALSYYILWDTENNADYVRTYAADSGSPFVSGTLLTQYTGSSGGYFYRDELDITSIVSGSTVSAGLSLTSNGATESYGAVIFNLAVTKLVIDGTHYNVLKGTSMASPHVAGLAAMLFAYNPDFTAADVVNAIKTGGVDATALSGKTVTGKAVNAMGSLSIIKAPTNVTAVKN